MIEILHSVKNIIEKFIVNKTPLCGTVSTGDTTIPMASTRRFQIGDPVVIYHQQPGNNDPEGEVHVITDLPDNRTMIIDTPLVSGWPASNTFVEKMIGFESGTETWIDNVYIGNPPVIARFPAITVNGSSRDEEWMSLESTKATYNLEINVYVEAAHYETQQELMYSYAKSIESALFRSLYPLVKPYDVAILQADITPSDLYIQLDDTDFFNCGFGWVFIESYDFLRLNKPIQDLGGGAYKLYQPAGAFFEAGSKVIRPRRHLFNAIPKGTQYGDTNKGGMLKSAKISYVLSEERLIYVPFVDPLTF